MLDLRRWEICKSKERSIMRGIRKWIAMGLATVMAGTLLTGTAVFAGETEAANTDVAGEVRYAYWDDNQTPYM